MIFGIHNAPATPQAADIEVVRLNTELLPESDELPDAAFEELAEELFLSYDSAEVLG